MTAAATLHIVNGKSIVGKVRGLGTGGTILPWDDVLHEGPVPADLDAAALRGRRAEFLASSDAGSRDEIVRGLEARDRALDDASGGAKADALGRATAPPLRDNEIVLWFEHDLFDQLLMIQVLDRLPVEGGPTITAVHPSTYLGYLPATDYRALYEGRRAVTVGQRLAAREAWQAFRSPDPRAILDVLPRVTALKHLAGALTRHLEQFPSVTNGLSRTEQQTLEAVAGGVTRIYDVFMATQNREAAFFMGDAGFLFHIASLFGGNTPLLRAVAPGHPGTSTMAPWHPGSLELSIDLTSDGERVMKGELDRVVYCGIDRWLGGVHLSSNAITPIWRWDQARQTLRVLEGG